MHTHFHVLVSNLDQLGPIHTNFVRTVLLTDIVFYSKAVRALRSGRLILLANLKWNTSLWYLVLTKVTVGI